jgi:hypothetical protein
MAYLPEGFDKLSPNGLYVMSRRAGAVSAASLLFCNRGTGADADTDDAVVGRA